MVERLDTSASAAAHSRSHEELKRFFAGFDLVDPGLACLALWHPDSQGLGKVEVSQVAGAIGGWWPGGYVPRE